MVDDAGDDDLVVFEFDDVIVVCTDFDEMVMMTTMMTVWYNDWY